MKNPDQIQLSWKCSFGLHVPVDQRYAAILAERALIITAVITVALGAAPFLAVLAGQ